MYLKSLKYKLYQFPQWLMQRDELNDKVYFLEHSPAV